MVYRRKFAATIKTFCYLQYEQKLSNKNWKQRKGARIACFNFYFLDFVFS